VNQHFNNIFFYSPESTGAIVGIWEACKYQTTVGENRAGYVKKVLFVDKNPV